MLQREFFHINAHTHTQKESVYKYKYIQRAKSCNEEVSLKSFSQHPNCHHN